MHAGVWYVLRGSMGKTRVLAVCTARGSRSLPWEEIDGPVGCTTPQGVINFQDIINCVAFVAVPVST